MEERPTWSVRVNILGCPLDMECLWRLQSSLLDIAIYVKIRQRTSRGHFDLCSQVITCNKVVANAAKTTGILDQLDDTSLMNRAYAARHPTFNTEMLQLESLRQPCSSYLCTDLIVRPGIGFSQRGEG
jgi:hypothetical protein